MLDRIIVEFDKSKKQCKEAETCSGNDCKTFGSQVQDVIVAYQDQGGRFLFLVFDEGTVQLWSVGRKFREWQPAPGTSDRRQILRGNAKIKEVFVDGERIDCMREGVSCRITFHQPASQAAQ